MEFNFIIDRRTLGLASLSITDIDVVDLSGTPYIILTDLLNGLIIFKYNEDNSIEDIRVIPVAGAARQFAESPEGTWLVATEKYVLDCTYNKQLTIVKKY